jgi:hypothetical protein
MLIYALVAHLQSLASKLNKTRGSHEPESLVWLFMIVWVLTSL